MRRLFLINILMLLAMSAVHGELTTSAGGPGAFLKYNLGARAQALAGATTALIGDEQAMNANPSSLALVKQQSISANYIALPGGGDFSQLTYSLPIGSFSVTKDEKSGSVHQQAYGAIGFYLVRMVTSYNIEARQTDSINPDYFFQDSAGVYALALGLPFADNWGAGITLKGLYHLLDQEDAHGWGVDGGVYWKGFDGLTLGFAVKDGYTNIYWTTSHWERVLTKFSLASTYNYKLDPVQLALHGQLEKDMSEAPVNYGIGLESTFYRYIVGRIGYNGQLSFGLGLTWPKFGFGQADLTFDYALVEDKITDWNHWVSLKITF